MGPWRLESPYLKEKHIQHHVQPSKDCEIPWCSNLQLRPTPERHVVAPRRPPTVLTNHRTNDHPSELGRLLLLLLQALRPILQVHGSLGRPFKQLVRKRGWSGCTCYERNKRTPRGPTVGAPGRHYERSVRTLGFGGSWHRYERSKEKRTCMLTSHNISICCLAS